MLLLYLCTSLSATSQEYDYIYTFFGKRDNGADLVETAFLMQGLLAARQYFSGDNVQEKMIREKITNIWEKVEWDWFRQYPDNKFLYWHWSPDQEWVINHKLIGWNETMVVYLLAIASPSHPVPAEMYYTGWANQDNTGQKYRSNWGGTKDGSMYTTASDGPYDYSADEPMPGRDIGKLALTGAISSFPYTPEESMKALKNYYYNYGRFL